MEAKQQNHSQYSSSLSSSKFISVQFFTANSTFCQLIRISDISKDLKDFTTFLKSYISLTTNSNILDQKINIQIFFFIFKNQQQYPILTEYEYLIFLDLAMEENLREIQVKEVFQHDENIQSDQLKISIKLKNRILISPQQSEQNIIPIMQKYNIFTSSQETHKKPKLNQVYQLINQYQKEDINKYDKKVPDSHFPISKNYTNSKNRKSSTSSQSSHSLLHYQLQDQDENINYVLNNKFPKDYVYTSYLQFEHFQKIILEKIQLHKIGKIKSYFQEFPKFIHSDGYMYTFTSILKKKPTKLNLYNFVARYSCQKDDYFTSIHVAIKDKTVDIYKTDRFKRKCQNKGQFNKFKEINVTEVRTIQNNILYIKQENYNGLQMVENIKQGEMLFEKGSSRIMMQKKFKKERKNVYHDDGGDYLENKNQISQNELVNDQIVFVDEEMEDRGAD